jgi:hypothetical protein
MDPNAALRDETKRDEMGSHLAAKLLKNVLALVEREDGTGIIEFRGHPVRPLRRLSARDPGRAGGQSAVACRTERALRGRS